MAMNFLSVYPKHERRIRLVFDNSLAAAAFTSTSYYTVASQDFAGTSPTVSAAYAIAGNPNAVELALGADLAQGGTYLVSVAAVPCVDLSTATGSLPFNLGTSPLLVNREVPTDDYASALYGIDLVHTGADFLETADGDLATLDGLPNAEQAIRRRMFGDPLPWDPSWGAFARQWVDSATGGALPLKGALARQAYLDDRVKLVKVSTVTDANDPYSVYFDVLVTLVGGETITPIPVQVQN